MPSAYTTKELMERRFGALGVKEFGDLDNDNTIDANVVSDAITMASEELNLWLAMRYEPAQLATSSLIERWATELACYYLCTTRGNDPPSSLAKFYEDLTKKNGYLWKLQKGLMQLPGIATKGDLRPTVSNLTIDRRWTHSKARVTKANSTDAPTQLTQDGTIDEPTLYE